MKRTIQLIIAIIIISFAIGIYFYGQMPDQMASHWGAGGEVNGYMSKFWGLFLMPVITLAMFLLLIAIPYIDPLKRNIDKFRKYFDWFIYLMVLFLFYIYILTILWNLGYRFDMGLAIMPALAVLFYTMGVVIQRAKRNWFIGIRTPWTLSSDEVWDRTHKLGGNLFKAVAVTTLVGMLFGENAIWFVLVPAVGVALFTMIYSYFIYVKLEKRHPKGIQSKESKSKKK